MIRGLIYHATPIGNWRMSYNLLLENISKINGSKICAIAQGSGLINYSKLHQETSLFDEVILIENDPILRESASLPSLIKRIMVSECDVVLYAHTKGVTHGPNDKAVRLWTEACYHHSFNKIDLMHEQLSYGLYCSGVFKRYGRFSHFPAGS